MSLLQGSIIVYFLIIYLFGIFKKSKSNTESYIFAGRKLTLPAFVATLVSTWYGGILEVGQFSYDNGIITWIIFGVFYYIAALIFAFTFAPKINKLNIKSIPSLINKHFGKLPGLISFSLIILLSSPAPYLIILSTLLIDIWPINKNIAIIFGIFISTVYTYRGGFSSVIRTDKIQFILMFFGFLYLIFNLYIDYGGLKFIKDNANQNLLSIPGNYSWTSIFVWSLIALVTFIDPSFFQRSYSGKNILVVKKGIIISIAFWLLFDFMTITTGIYASILIPDLISNPYTDLSKLVLGPIGHAIFIISLISIVMSTIDSYTFISAYTIGYDLPLILNKSSKNTVNNTKRSLLLISIISVIMAILFSSALQIWYIVGSLAVSVIFIPIICATRNYNIKNKIIFFVLPLVITAFWMLHGLLNRSDGYPQYFLSIDPMYPGLLSSFLYFYIFKSKKEINKNEHI